ncbi:hypothetical protein MTO96_022890 [Rhipicephalus appendiculatus]
MPASCCAFGCSNSVLRGKRLFRIPLSEKDAARRQMWLAIIKREGFVPTAGSRLCEDHFEPDQFEQHRADGRKLLKCNAVPTIPGPGTLAGSKKRRRRNRRAPSTTKRRCSPSGSVDAEAVDAAKPAERSSSAGRADALTCKALQIRFAAGQRGYAVVREMCLGFPTEVQLRHCVEALPFEPGVLDGLLPALEHKISTMQPGGQGTSPSHWTGWQYYQALTRPWVGWPVNRLSMRSFSLWRGWLRAGSRLWGYHLLPGSSSFTSTALCSALKDVLFQVVERCEALGLTVDALVTDLSACSLSLWKQCGVSTCPSLRQPVFSTRHPCATEQSDRRRLVVLADVTSLFAKNNADNLGFVHAVELDRLSPKWTRKRASTCDAVLNLGTVTGLRCLRAVELLPKEAETTAWFVEQGSPLAFCDGVCGTGHDTQTAQGHYSIPPRIQGHIRTHIACLPNAGGERYEEG